MSNKIYRDQQGQDDNEGLTPVGLFLILCLLAAFIVDII